MAHETLADIQQEHIERVARARRYDDLKGQYNNNARVVERLEAQSVGTKPATRLERIIDESSKLDDAIIGSIGGLMPVSGMAKTLLSALATSALANVRRKDEQRHTALDAAKKLRDDAKRALDQEYPE